jgi:hypothetical protein
MTRLRWQLFKIISAIGWWVCPEPHRTNLQAGIPTWEQTDDLIERALRGDQ